MVVVDISELNYTYPAAVTPALNGVSLQVEQGEFLAIVGNNGAGKSTLCYALAGFVPHHFKGRLHGKVLVTGLDTQKVSLNELVIRVGLVFQNPFNQISGTKYTVYEEIAFGLENTGVPREQMGTRIETAMELTGIADLKDRSPYSLSGGQQQRVALASILVMEPKVLVLDEPTSQLDPVGSREVFQVIKEMSERGMTVILVEHKVEWIAQYADRVVALHEGQILIEGKPRDVLTSPLLPERGFGLSRYTMAAREAREGELWPAGLNLPVTLQEAVDGFSRQKK
jgi:energy-coupling factor transporter ATP-binding protein EcfA2